MSVGGWNSLPTQVGGGTTEFERTTKMLERTVGKGGSADDPDTVEQAWRRSKALGLSASNADERAVLQWFPDTATDFLPEHERILQIDVPPNASEQERRNAVEARFVDEASSVVSDLETRLRAIDPALSLVEVPHAEAKTTEAGRTAEPRDGSEPFGAGMTQTEFPNLSDDFVEVVHYDIGPAGSEPTIAQEKTIEEAKEALHEQLPAWIDFRVATEIGITLDQTPVGLGVFDE